MIRREFVRHAALATGAAVVVPGAVVDAVVETPPSEGLLALVGDGVSTWRTVGGSGYMRTMVVTLEEVRAAYGVPGVGFEPISSDPEDVDAAEFATSMFRALFE
jgi:hypothetical protein